MLSEDKPNEAVGNVLCRVVMRLTAAQGGGGACERGMRA